MKRRLLSALLAAGMAASLLPTVACAAPVSYTEENATLIAFSDTGAAASGQYSGYEIDGTAVSITDAGTYVLSGACADGSVTVKKEVTGVTLVLNGLELSSASTAPITVGKAAEASLLAAAGSENTVADSAGANDESAAIKVKTGGTLTLGGTGALTVQGNDKNGIKGAAEASITVDALTLAIDAVDDGLSCDDELAILGGALTITAGGDAVKASPDADDETDPDTVSQGDITISGGTLTLVSAADGIQADGDLTVTGGSFDITANGGHETALAEDASSCKGMKAGGALTVTGGSFAIDSADDALHADTVSVTGGSFTLATGDDAVHADDALTIGTASAATEDGTLEIRITASYEGLEGTTVDIYSGDIDIVASDDGVNAANSDIGERSDRFAINIHGGDLYIDAGSDGLDSNNDINMTGGTVEVYGADAGMDVAIDYDGTFTLSGGTLFGAGMTPTAGTQAYVAVGSTASFGGGRPGGMGGGRGGMNGGTPPDGADAAADPSGGRLGGADRGTPPADGMEPPDNAPDGAAGGAPARPDGMGGGMAPESALGITEGSIVTIQDGAGNTLYTATALGSMSSVIFSSAAVEEGATYTVLVDGEAVGDAEAVLGTGGGMSSADIRTEQSAAALAAAAGSGSAGMVKYAVSEGLRGSVDTLLLSADAARQGAVRAIGEKAAAALRLLVGLQ